MGQEERYYLSPSYSTQENMERLCRRPVRPMAEYALARAAASAKLTGELHAQVRQNRQVLDDFIFRFGGSETLKIEAHPGQVYSNPRVQGLEGHVRDVAPRHHASDEHVHIRLAGHAGDGGLQGCIGPRQGWHGHCGRVPPDASGSGRRPRHSILPMGVDDFRLSEDGAAVAVSTGQLHLSLREACAPEVSEIYYFVKRILTILLNLNV